ncbi:MAG TPA: hypothetical protein VGN23_06530 [Verrucomicrobiae bacterium]
MIQFGHFGINIGGFVDLSALFLTESAKYLLLFMFAVLSIRLWKRALALATKNKRVDLIVASIATLITVTIGYFSVCHSMGRLYAYYGMQAFDSGNVPSALTLFGQSSRYWKTADAQGAQGVCLVALGRPEIGLTLINQAKAMRGGNNNPFEEFYEGLYYFFNEKPEGIAYLARAASYQTYTWSALKLVSTHYIDNNQCADAERLMQPFLKIPVTDTDQAYVMASIDLSHGKKAEAQALVDKFGGPDIQPFWKTRFDKLRAAIQKS